jgi:hypothetical protein
MTKVSVSPCAQNTPAWHAGFLVILPAIARFARRAFLRLGQEAREEAVQAVIASSALAYARLFELEKTASATAASLANYGVKHYRSGRVVGGKTNCRDVGSMKCRRRGCVTEPFEEWQEAICQDRRATPAEIAALRIDLGEWLNRLSPRDRQLAAILALGEQTSSVAKMFRVTAGRVSQLRHMLYENWLAFTGDTALEL